MTTETIDINTLLNWGPAKRVNTSKGPKNLRKAKPDENFWAKWKVGKQALKDAGISCSPVGGDFSNWEVCWWQNVSANEVEAENKAIEQSRAVDLDVELIVPEGKAYLPYQRAGIATAIQWSNVLIADEMGLGKTIQAIGVINNRLEIKRVLIICPNSLKVNWRNELEAWLTRKFSIGLCYGGKPWPDTDIVIINYDILGRFKKQLTAFTWDLRIIDEAQYVKNLEAARTKHTYATLAKRKVTLTGTPIENRPREIWPMLNDLRPDLYPKFFKFGLRYCAGRQIEVLLPPRTVRNKKTGELEHHKGGPGLVWTFDGASHLDELQRELRTSCMVRRLKKDVLTELPPKRRQMVPLDPTGFEHLLAKERSFAELEEEIEKLQADCELAKCEGEDAFEKAVAQMQKGLKAKFEEQSKLRHETAVAKIEQGIEFVETALENGPCIVFAHHVDVLDALLKRWPAAPHVFGGMSPEARQAAVEAFQEGDGSLPFIGSLKAAGVGLTLTKATQVIFMEMDWVPGVNIQAEDRAHRIGQRESILCSYLVFDGSMDSRLAKVNIQKMNVIDKALDKVLEARQPVGAVDAVSITFDEIRKVEMGERGEPGGIKFQYEQIEAIHDCLKILAGLDPDGARDKNDVGFNGCDSAIGRSMAGQSRLSPKQTMLGMKIIRKYHRQLPGDLLATAKGKGND